ncbi:MAG: YafY family transcriptional regulator [Alphaproteobacteria bacterium]|nr:YafY family transcriptional regulator [Alphaproteobacteria bacterium]
MRRADRLFQIVQYLRGGRLLTAARLAESLEVSERTIYRDIADLQASGVPIDGEAGVGYVMRDGYDLPPLMFTRDEIVALVAGARLIRAWGGAAMARAAEEALVKIDSVLPDAERGRANKVEIHAIALEMTPGVRARIDEIERAVEARRRLTVAYTDAEDRATERTVRPLGLWFWGKVWTLVAWCELRDDFRMFRLDRIARMDDSGDRFRPERGKTLADFYRTMEEQP